MTLFNQEILDAQRMELVRQEAIALGRKAGQLDILRQMIDENELSLEKTANIAGMTPEEFTTKSHITSTIF